MARPAKNNCDVLGYRYRRPAFVTIYLIRIANSNSYKIGYTAQHIKDRMRVIKFYKFKEKKINNGYREWFNLNNDDVEFIKNLFTSIRNG